MLTETQKPGSDDRLLIQLGGKLSAGLERYQKLRSHLKGEATVIDGGNKHLAATYTRFLNLSRLNMAEPIVKAMTTRLRVIGFETTTVGDAEGDAAAQELWEAANGGIVTNSVTHDTIAHGLGYGIVARSADGTPVFMRGAPWNTYAKRSLQTPWKADAAISYTWLEDEGLEVLTLFRPGTQRLAVRRSDFATLTEDSESWFMDTDWTWATDEPVSLDWTDEVCVVPLQTPEELGRFETHTDALDRINTKIFQRLCIIVMQAFRQRAIKGNLPEFYPDNDPLGRGGQRIPYDQIFESGPAALWRLPPDAEIWESAVTTIEGLITDSKEEIRNLATVTGTPLYILMPDAVGGSAQGAALARETIVEDVKDEQEYLKTFMASVMRLMFAASGSPRSDRVRVKLEPPDRASMVEKAQAASQSKGILPNRTIWREIFQFSPAQINQIEQDEADDKFSEVDGGEPDETAGTALDDDRDGDQAPDSSTARPVGATQAG